MIIKCVSACVLIVFLCDSTRCDTETDSDAYNDKELTVILSFDSYNPCSVKFFKEQVAPVFDALSPCVKWHFIPCSTSHIVDDVMKCKEGVWECQMDVLHACAAHFYEDDQIKLGKFFICMMTDDAQFIKGEGCAKQACMDWEKLKGCKPSEQAGQFCNNRYNQLDILHAKYVPGVMFNWRYNEKTEAGALANLKDAVCTRLQKMKKSCPSCPAPPCEGGNAH